MADSTIEAILRLRDQLSGPLRGVGSVLTATVSKVDQVNNSLRQAAATATGMKGSIAGALAGIGVGIGFKEILDLSSNFEDTALSIAGNIKAFDLAPTFEASKVAAEDALNTIDNLAAKLPGEADQYIQVFKTALPKAIESGLGSVKEVADFTSKYTAVAISNQIDATQAGMDLMRMLGGQAGLDVRTWQSLNPHLKVTSKILKELHGHTKGLQVGAGLTAEAFNKLSAVTRRELIQGAIGKFDEQMTAAGDTFSAKMGELTSRVKKLIRTASEPMFEAAKQALTQINEYLEQNKDALAATAHDAFLMAADYLPKIVDALKYAMDHAEQIKDFMIAGALAWTGSQFLGALSQIATIASAMGLVGGGAAAASAGGVAAGGIGAAMTGLFSSILGSLAVGAVAGAGFEELRERREAYNEGFDSYEDLQEATNRAHLIMNDWDRMHGTLMDFDDAMLLAKDALEQEAFERWKVGDELKAYKTMLVRSAADVQRDIPMMPGHVWAKTPKGRSGPPNMDFRNSRFDIKQQFAEGFDPDRIAVAFSQDLARVGEMKLQAAVGMRAGFVR
jgi:hypothetical protein